MKAYFAPVVLGILLVLSSCTNRPLPKPVVSDRQVTPREIEPGESISIAFKLGIKEPSAVKRVFVRGLPENTIAAGTNIDLPLPDGQSTFYATQIELVAPVNDGQYNLELVLNTRDKTYFAPLGSLAVRDVPSRILYTQFLPGSHVSDDCSLGTKLLEFQYAVSDDNGAADFVGAALTARNSGSKDLVFFPHWEPISTLGGKPGIFLEPPTKDTVTEELVTSDIRIHCRLPGASLYEFEVEGQSVSRLTGQSIPIGSDPARYYVE